ncbi:MAG: hypothetical protein V4719_11975 [Planctomycetota bacterium]
MNNNRFTNYLLDLGLLVKEKARQSRAINSQNSDAYNAGYLMAWHEIVSLMQLQCEQFGIELSSVGLDGIDPERDLL